MNLKKLGSRRVLDSTDYEKEAVVDFSEPCNKLHFS
jgi:hypothetical protein